MKKQVLFLIAAFIICGAMYAQETSSSFSINYEISSFWVPFQYVKPAPGILEDDIDERFVDTLERDALYLSGLGRPGGSSYEAVVNLTGQLENKRAGFFMGLFYQNGLSAKPRGWIRPFDWMRIDVGSIKNNDLKKLPVDYYPKLDSFMPRAGRDDDIFTNYEVEHSVLFQITPVEDLFLGFFVYNQPLFSMGENAAARPLIGGEDPRHSFQRIQATIGYAIPSIGLARIQYRGVNPDVNIDTHQITSPRIEAAFTFTGIKDLIVDMGGKIHVFLEDPQVSASGRVPIPALPSAYYGAGSLTGTKKYMGRYQAPQQISLAAQYRLTDLGPGTLSLNGRFDSKFAGWYQELNKNVVRMGPDIKMSLWPTYQINSWVFSAETTMVYGGDWVAYGRTLYRGGFGYGFGAYAQLNIFGGNILMVGFAVSGGEGLVLPKNGASQNSSTLSTHDNVARVSTPDDRGVLPTVISIPIKINIRL